VICDRASVDGIAYDEAGVLDILKEKSMVRSHLLHRYSAVLHLKSAACGAAESYTRANNAARFESVEQAARRDELVLNAWLGHNHLTIIPSRHHVSDKEEHVKQAIRKVLGIPHCIEIERRFLVSTEKLGRLPVHHTSAHIEQRYLRRKGVAIPRIRARSYGGITTYEHGIKTNIDARRTQEQERALSYREYAALSEHLYPGSRPVYKERTYFAWGHHVFELDVFSGTHKGLVMLEVELCTTEEHVELPPFIPITKEVTGDARYSNAALAGAL
jgi:CYTH domain-containing protein